MQVKVIHFVLLIGKSILETGTKFLRKVLKMSETKLLGLTSGEQIIAKSKFIDGAAMWKLENPAIIIPVGKGELALAPWLPYSTVEDTGIEIKDSSVTFVTTPRTELVNQYSTMFGSGLVIPNGVSAPKLSLVE